MRPMPDMPIFASASARPFRRDARGHRRVIFDDDIEQPGSAMIRMPTADFGRHAPSEVEAQHFGGGRRAFGYFRRAGDCTGDA